MALKRMFCLLTGAIMLFASSAAWSAEVNGRISTQFNWYNDTYTEKKQIDFGEYLSLSVTKLDQDNKLTIQGYGRLTQSTNAEGLNGRLYYLYGDYSNLFDKVDIRLGRQFVNSAAGSAIIDGGKIDLKNVGPVAFSIMGGRNVFFGLINGETTSYRDFAFGVGASLYGYRNTDAELSYFMKLDNEGVARDQLGASFKHYLLNSVKVYGNTRYDIPSETFSEVLAGVKYYPRADLVLTGEWYQSYPIFDSTSIYSVFAVSRYQEGVFKVDYSINDKISVNAGYSRQVYEGADADVFELGCRVRPIEHLQVALDYDHRNGYGGDLNGGIIEVTYDINKKIEVAGGIHFDVYERDKVTGEETARKYWMGSKYKINDKMSASVRVEDNVNARYKEDWTGRMAFNYDF